MRRIPLALRFVFVLAAVGSGSGFTSAADRALAANPATSSVDAALDSLFAAPTLEISLVEHAVIVRNPTLAARRAAWAGMKARADVEAGWDDPMVEGMIAPQSLGSSSVDPAWSAELSQTIPIFGGRSIRGDALRAD